MNDYEKYRGRCREFSEEAVRTDPTLTLVRGHYICPVWGEQQHWWIVRQDGSIFDPTARQFPSMGQGEYVPFNGIVPCSNCGKEMQEQEVPFSDGRFVFCSGECYGHFVGVT